MSDYRREYKRWINDPFFDEKTREELKNLSDEKEIEDRFYKRLSFGTGGLRGVIGAGTNRMNLYTVGQASQGLADFINSQTQNGSIVIAYDSRNMSYEFAEESALIFAANGIKVYIFESLRPTPELSFAVRYLKTTAGIVITASHNPPQYNGYKVYWTDGAQIVPPYDTAIIEKVNAVTDFKFIKKTSKEKATENGLLFYVGKDVDDAYIEEVKGTVLNPDAIARHAKNIKIVYTPLNGAGKVPVLRVLKELGFVNVWTVKEQEMPDGNFPTLKYPNPEDPKAFDLALLLAKEKDADIVLATDPDSDRLGVYVKGEGGYVPWNGNMSGLFLAEYELSEKKRKGLLPANTKDAAIVTTIVSSRLSEKIAEEYGVSLFQVLTGFKYIGEKIKQFEDAKLACAGKTDYTKGAYDFIFGFEESYGSLIGTYARDKDAVTAACALCEATAFYKEAGVTLYEQMNNIYRKYGYFKEDLFTKTFYGADGARKINDIMNSMRNGLIPSIGNQKVLAIRDYKTKKRVDINGSVSDTGLAESDVLYYELENDGWCCVRPSGTEPKIKLYFGVKGNTEKEAATLLENLRQAIIAVIGN